MLGQQIGSTIAAVFGLIYVLVNTGSLPPTTALALRALAGIAFGLVLIGLFTSRRAGRGHDGPPQQIFTRGYWIVVVIEFVALFAGARILSGPLGIPQAGVAWVSFVVGVHFFPLAVIFKQRFYHLVGAVIAACGLIGIVLALLGRSAATIDVAAGVLPGAILLGFGWWGMRRSVSSESDRAQPAAETDLR